MGAHPFGVHQASPAELRDRLEAERKGRPFLVYRDGEGVQQIVTLDRDRSRVTLGRDADADVALPWDGRVSRLHAELLCLGDHWLVVDDGLSRNGTFVGAERVTGRRRLRDTDVLRLGATPLLFRAPGAQSSPTTRLSDHAGYAARVTDAQRRVLVALCRPLKGSSPYATPATNPQIAAELVLSVPAVKTHLRALFEAFGIEDLPQQEKRVRLAAIAFASGVVRESDL
jgi:pSer/pThr/pTyr-binding forkhead associated (FHA) protein